MSRSRLIQHVNINPSNVIQSRAWVEGFSTAEVQAGSKRLLIFMYGSESFTVPQPLLTATLNGVSGVIKVSSSIDTGLAATVSLAYWDEAALVSAGVGTHPIVFTVPNAVDLNEQLGASSQYGGVDQVNPFGDTVVASLGGDGPVILPAINRLEGGVLIESNMSGNFGGVATPPAEFTTTFDSVAGVSSNLQIAESPSVSQDLGVFTFTGAGNNRIAFLCASVRRSLGE